MPTPKKGASSTIARQLKPQSFIAALVKDPARPPKVRLISGFIGESSEKDHTRIYLDAELRRYVDIPSNGIVHAKLVPEASSPLGGVHVWVREDVAIRHRGSWAGGEDPTTMATGEEGGDPTTMATGEEGGGPENPWISVVNPNPFGRF